jgi:hypothetical protein
MPTAGVGSSLRARLRERLSGVPDAVRGAVSLAAGERLLAWAATPAGPVVATTWRLVLPAGAGEPEQRSLGWDQIDKATWAAPVLTVTPAADDAPLRLRLDPPRGVPAVVRARVTQAVVYSRRESLAPLPGAVRVVGRRCPRTGQLRWEVIYDPRTPAGDPAVEAVVQQLLDQARTELAGGVED